MNFYFIVIALWLCAVTARKPPLLCSNHTFNISHINGFRPLSINASPQDAGSCHVEVNITHGFDNVYMAFDLPMPQFWGGRFLAQGGGNYATGLFDHEIGLQNGFAVGSTDGGHSYKNHADISWALHENRTVNWGLLDNFAHRSLVDLINIGKNITKQYYGSSPRYTYWYGCSTGGRQGYSIAQRSPGLVNGILANAPAISFERLAMLGFWPHVQMQARNVFPLGCELDFVRAKAIEYCDHLDGVCDGILEDPQQCNFDPSTLVGVQVPNCMTESPVYITKEVAKFIADMHEGFQWGLDPEMTNRAAWGVNITALAGISISNGSRSIAPIPPAASWVKHMMYRDPNYNLAQVNEAEYLDRFHKTLAGFGSLLHSDNPDLSALRDSGTKMLTFHGMQDSIVPYENTIEYRKRAEKVMGGADELNKYYRLFLGSGVEHCFGGSGPEPSKDVMMKALIGWVEHGIPPKSLPAQKDCTDYAGNRDHIIRCPNNKLTRNLCLWPAKQMHVGGYPEHATSWTCVNSVKGLRETIKGTQPDLVQRLVADLMAGNVGGL